jgi:hypothetical protein
MTAISDKFEFLRLNVVDLGAALAEEEDLPDGGARQDHEFGSLYFHPRVGEAFECHGLILATYKEIGEQDSGLGYPLSDEQDAAGVPGGRVNFFEGGSLVFSPAIGVTTVFDDLPVVRQVVVKLVDGVAVPLERGGALGLDDLAAVLGLSAEDPLVQAIRFVHPGLVARRLFDELADDVLLDMVASAQAEDPAYIPPDFFTYLAVDCPDGVDPEAVATAVQAVGGLVELAYVQAEPSDPAVVGTGNPLFVGQGYLGAAPTGVGVQAMWARAADGSGSRFIDLEQGWLLRHDDLPAGIPLLAGQNRHASFPHGCAVLGEMIALDNASGIVGMAPAALPRLISYFDRVLSFGSPRLRATIASRITVAARSLRLGDVLQLEVQLGGTISGADTVVPVETDPAVFEAIRLTTRLGVIVTEAAGNGSADLDQFQRSGRFVLSRNGTDFRDSGAIIVGACTSAVPHTRLARSNFGSRVDCCAWGENVLTTGNPAQPDRRDGFWSGPFFGGTSGATPVISSLCMLVQDLQTLLMPKPGQLGRLGPGSMRAIMRSAANGTTVQGGIGPMPDGAAILRNEYVQP